MTLNRYSLFVLIFCSISFFSCKNKQQQFITTLTMEDSAATKGQIDTAVLVLQKRLQAEKIIGATVTANYSNHQITVQSGNLDKDWIRSYLLKKGALVFYECYSILDLVNSLKEADKIVAGKIAINQTGSISNPLFAAFDDIAQPNGTTYSPGTPGYIGQVSQEKLPLLKKYLELGKDAIPLDATICYREQQEDKSKRKYYEVYFLKENDNKFFASDHIKSSEPNFDGKYTAVNMTLDAYGTNVWSRMTTRNVNKTLAIVIDGKVLTAPRVVSPIEGGMMQIAGVFEKQEAKDIAHLLQSGYLPLKLQLKNITGVKIAE